MLIIPDVLKREQVRHVLDVLARSQFVDGRVTAGEMARDVKRNLQFKRPENQPVEIEQIVGRALMLNRTFQDFAMPKHMAPPTFSKYEPGMEYGTHVDTPLMGHGATMRSDLSLTVFLSDPADYDGGELTVETGFGEQAVKLPPGWVVVYSSTTLHRVRPVTRGARLVGLSWVQSFVKDEGMREILYDIAIATQALDKPPEGSEAEHRLAIKNRLYKAYANLVRRQAEV
jgi:PKHD-type hydroxylase